MISPGILRTFAGQFRPIRVSWQALSAVAIATTLFVLAISGGGRDLIRLSAAQVVTLALLIVMVWTDKIRRSAITLPFLLIAGVVAASALWTVHLEASIRELLLWTMYGGIALLVASTLTGVRAARRFLDALIVIAGWLCLVAAFIFWGAGNPDMRWYSTFYWPNPFAAFLLLLLPLALMRFLHALRVRDVLVHGLTTVLLAVVLALTYSRGAWVALAVVAPLAIVLTRPLHWGRMGGRIVCLLLLVAAAVFAVTRGPTPQDAGRGVVVRAVSVLNLEDYSVQGRLNFWEAGLHIFEDHPLIGTGAGTFGSIHPAYQRDVRYYARDAHSLYIQTLAELGIVGLAVFGVLLVSVGKMWGRTLRAARGGEEYPLIAGVGLGLLAFFLHSAFDMDWMFPANPALAFALIGLLAWYDSSRSPREAGVKLTADGLTPATGRAPPPIWARAPVMLVLLIAGAATSIIWTAQYHFVLGGEAAQRGEWSQAAEHYAAAVRWNPLSSRYLEADASVLARSPEPQPALAARLLRRGMAVDRENASVPLQLAGLLLTDASTLSSLDEVEHLTRQALTLDPLNRPQAYRLLADVYLRQGRWEDANHVYRRAVGLYLGRGLGSGSAIYMALWPEVIQLCQDAADAAAMHGDRPWAAHILVQLLAEDPRAISVALQLSQVYVAMGQIREARSVLEGAAARAPDNAQIHAALEALTRYPH